MPDRKILYMNSVHIYLTFRVGINPLFDDLELFDLATNTMKSIPQAFDNFNYLKILPSSAQAQLQLDWAQT